MWESRRKVEREVREGRTGGRNSLLWMEAREIGEITQQYNAQYFAMAKALGVRNQGKREGSQEGKVWGAGGLDPCTTFPTRPPPLPSANETIDNPQSIHVLVDVLGKKGREGYGRQERRERQEKREKWGKLRNNGQYFVIKKRDKVKKRGGGIRDCKVREAGVTPPPPNPQRAPSPPLLYNVDGSLVS